MTFIQIVSATVDVFIQNGQDQNESLLQQNDISIYIYLDPIQCFFFCFFFQNGQDQNGSTKEVNGKTVTFADDNKDDTDDEDEDEGVTNKKLYQALVERESDK